MILTDATGKLVAVLSILFRRYHGFLRNGRLEEC